MQATRPNALMWLLTLLVALGGCSASTGGRRSNGGKGTRPPVRETARGGAIRGTLWIPTGDAGSPADAVVYVTAVPGKSSKALAAGTPPARIVQVGHRFVPTVVPVLVGGTVEFQNGDTVYHNVFSVSTVRRFDVGKIAPGEVRRVTFDRPGVLRVYCDLHPEEAGFVLVLPSPAFARPDAAGSFTIPRLATGAYTVKAWHPVLGERTRKVTVPAHGDGIADLRY